jgi:uncharacterized membrane protein
VRCTGIDKKIFWQDESVTALRASGWTFAELVRWLDSTPLVDAETLRRIQMVSGAGSFVDTVRSLASEDPQHPPLYYLAARAGESLTGNTVTGTRWPAVIFGLIAFPAMWWLAWLLFRDGLAALIALALFALSPFHIAYAQEAREYSLATLVALTSSAFLLSAIDRPGPRRWVAYAAAVAAGFYVYFFFVFVIFSHALFALIALRDDRRVQKLCIAWMAAGVAGGAGWLLTVAGNWGQVLGTNQGYHVRRSSMVLLNGWVDAIYRSFAYVPPGKPAVALAAALAVAAVAIPALIALRRDASPRTRVFVLALAGAPAVLLVVSDLVQGGRLSTINRHLIPTYLGAELAIAAALAAWARAPDRVSRIASGLTGFLLFAAGAHAAAAYSGSDFWWNKAGAGLHLPVAAIVNGHRPSAVIAGGSLDAILSISHLLQDDVAVAVARNADSVDIGALARTRTVYLLDPGRELEELVRRKGFDLVLIYRPPRWFRPVLWKAEKRT